MSWFRLSAVIFIGWAVVFFFFPRFANDFGGIGYTVSGHAEDWTQLVGLMSLGFAVLLNEAHRAANRDVRRVVARGALACTLPCALLMTYWQIIPNGRWIRLDIANIILLYAISYGMWLHGGLPWRASRPSSG
jgi:hypothetical protein